MKFIYVLTLCTVTFLLTIPLASKAQHPLKQYLGVDKLYLKDGTLFYGKLLDLTDVIVEFELISGKVIVVQRKLVRKIMQTLNKKAQKHLLLKARKIYNFKETGIYNSTFFNLPQGYDISNYWSSGMGIHHVIGYQHSRLMGIGFGLGFDGYELGSGRNVLSTYAELRGYLLPENFTPFYTLGIGYGFALKNQSRNIVDSKGGLFFNPGIGYRFGGSANANFILGLGYRVQTVTFSDRNWNNSIFTQKYNFNRLIIKFGLVF